jgi:hypothetical protein
LVKDISFIGFGFLVLVVIVLLIGRICIDLGAIDAHLFLDSGVLPACMLSFIFLYNFGVSQDMTQRLAHTAGEKKLKMNA